MANVSIAFPQYHDCCTTSRGYSRSLKLFFAYDSYAYAGAKSVSSSLRAHSTTFSLTMERFRGRFIRKSVLAGRKNLRNVFLGQSYHESQDEGSSIAHDDKSIGVDGSVCEDRSSTVDKFSASNAGVCIATLTPSPSDIDEARRADDGQPTSAFSQTDLLLCENDDSAKGRRERAGNIENHKKKSRTF